MSSYCLKPDPSVNTAYHSSAHQVWIEIAPGRYVIHKVMTAEADAEIKAGHIPKEWFKRVERTLSMLITTATL